MIYFLYMEENQVKKKQKRRKTKNSKANSLLYFAVVLIIVAILLYFDIKNMTSVGKKIKESKNEDNIEVVEEETTAPEEEKGKYMNLILLWIKNIPKKKQKI